MIKIILTILFLLVPIITFGAAPIKFNSFFTVDNLNTLLSIDFCNYTKKDNRKAYKFCKVKLNPCTTKPSPGFYKYHKKIKEVLQLTQYKIPTVKDEIYIYSLIECESNQNPKIISIDQGYGLFQITTNKKEPLDLEQNSKKGLNLLKNKQLYIKNKSEFYNQQKITLEEENTLLWYYTLRSYNGGYKQLYRYYKNYKTKIYPKIDNQIYFFYSQCYYPASTLSGRYPCFEKVNVFYPFKIMILTSPIYSKYIF